MTSNMRIMKNIQETLGFAGIVEEPHVFSDSKNETINGKSTGKISDTRSTEHEKDDAVGKSFNHVVTVDQPASPNEIEQPVENEPTEIPSDHAAARDEMPIDDNVSDESAGKPKSKIGRRSLSWGISSFIVLLTVAFGYRFLSVPKADVDSTPSNSDIQKSASAIQLSPDQTLNISVEIVQRHSVAGEVKSPGKVAFNGNQISPVLTQFSGRLVKLLAEVGQNVHAGQILGSVETPDIVQPQADYQQSLANERTAQTSLENLIRTRERAERLVKVEAIPLRELQQAQVDEKHAREDLERSRQAITAARSRLESLHFSDAAIKALESGSKVLNREVALVAPISGTIIERKAGIGQIVQPGGDPLFQIANLSTVWVNAEIYEEQLSRLRIGLPATVETPAYPNERFSARIDQIGSVVDADKRTVAVRCVLPNAAGKLKPGMFVNVTLGGVSSQDAITVPATAVATEGDKRVVYVESEAGHYEKREVVLGDEQGDSVVVKSGLKEGEKVVVKGGLLVAAEGENAN